MNTKRINKIFGIVGLTIARVARVIKVMVDRALSSDPGKNRRMTMHRRADNVGVTNSNGAERALQFEAVGIYDHFFHIIRRASRVTGNR